MAAAWIEEQRQQLKNIYHNCKNTENREPILEAFSIYLLRILNSLSQMESSSLYGYEAQMLGEAMRLFCEHYVTQVNGALEPGIDIVDKKAIIGDIEDAVSKISNVYKNVIDSTSNSDRQMLTSQAVETSIYDISPKLFAAYSTILETLVRLFGKQGVYAFLLHPSLKSNIGTVSLFDMREQEGKVVLIYIPENEIEKIRLILIYLLHEAFHVLTKEERNRKDRACWMELHVQNAISQRIFENVDFSFVKGSEEENIKNELSKRWFGTDERIQELKKAERDDRRFYSKNILKEIGGNWRDWLCRIFTTLGDDLRQVFEKRTYEHGENPYLRIMDMEWKIQNNLVEILAGGRIDQYANVYMTIYREAYADIACILASGISPDEYEQAFRDSEKICDEYDNNAVRAIRVHVVARAIVVCDGIHYAEEWKEYSEKHDFQKWRESEKQTEDAEEGENHNRKMNIFDLDLKCFEDILTNCSEKLWRILGQKDNGFESFRNIIRHMDLIEILDGSVNEKLREL